MLLVTLPTQPNAVRLRVWRALKALGCAALRDGAYLLPAALAPALDRLADAARQHGGSATVLALAARDDTQQAEWLALFDRSAAYAAWRSSTSTLLAELPGLAEPDARRRLRAVADALHTLHSTDYHPGPAAKQADADLAVLRSTLGRQFSPGEPHAAAPAPIALLDRAQVQAQRWATRARPGVDRLASAWLIRRFIDPQAELVWLPDTDTPPRTPRGALGFDYDGARFTHLGALVTFEVLLASFGLSGDTALHRLAGLVHYLDAGGLPVPEAAGLDSVLAGLRQLHADDDALVAAGSAVFDALYAAPAAGT